MVGIALAGWMVACGSADAETLRISAAANADAAAKVVRRYAEDNNYVNSDLYDKQLFKLSLGAESIGTLVTGSGVLTVNGRSNSTCFVALVRSDGKVSLTPTVGVGEWEVESCLSVEAVGAVSPQPKTGFGRIVVIHSAAAGRTETEPTVVLAWNPKDRRLEIDLDASRKAGEVPSTIAAVRKVLQ
jgi:hypothetical protein